MNILLSSLTMGHYNANQCDLKPLCCVFIVDAFVHHFIGPPTRFSSRDGYNGDETISLTYQFVSPLLLKFGQCKISMCSLCLLCLFSTSSVDQHTSLFFLYFISTLGLIVTFRACSSCAIGIPNNHPSQFTLMIRSLNQDEVYLSIQHYVNILFNFLYIKQCFSDLFVVM